MDKCAAKTQSVAAKIIDYWHFQKKPKPKLEDRQQHAPVYLNIFGFNNKI